MMLPGYMNDLIRLGKLLEKVLATKETDDYENYESALYEFKLAHDDTPTFIRIGEITE